MCFICNHMPIGELNTLLQLHISYSKQLLIPVVVGLILTDEREGKIDSYRKIFISTPVGFFCIKKKANIVFYHKILDVSLKI